MADKSFNYDAPEYNVSKLAGGVVTGASGRFAICARQAMLVKSIQAESGQLEDSGKCLTFMKQLMSVYAPELVDESLVDQRYNDIKLKMREVYNILMDIADDREKYIFYRNLIQNIRDALQLVVRGGVNKFDGQKSNAIAKLIVDALLETWEDLSENVWGEIE